MLEVDLGALRRAPVLWPAGEARGSGDAAVIARLGIDPRRDLDELVFAAASPEGGDARGAELLILARGRIDRERVVAALGRRGELVKQRARGHALYTPRDGETHSLLFVTGARSPVLAVVSAGWRERLLDRLERRGRSALAGRTLGAELRAARRGGATLRVASRLSPALARLIAHQTRWPELASLTTVAGGARAGERLEVELEAELVESTGAEALSRRLAELGRALTPPARSSCEGRRVRVRAELERELLRRVLERVAGG